MAELEDNVAKLEATKVELEQQTADLEKVKAETADYTVKKDGLTTELERVQTDITKAKEDRRQKDTSFQDKLRGENLTIAKEKFFGEFKYTDEERTRLEAEFPKYDSNSVSADLIYKDMLKAHVARDPQKYVELERNVNRLTAESEEFKARISGSGFMTGGLPATDSMGLSKEDIQAAQWAGIPLQEYARLKKEGKIQT